MTEHLTGRRALAFWRLQSAAQAQDVVFRLTPLGVHLTCHRGVYTASRMVAWPTLLDAKVDPLEQAIDQIRRAVARGPVA